MDTTRHARQIVVEAEDPAADPADPLYNLATLQRRASIDWWFRRLAQWLAVGGTTLGSIFFLMFLVWHILYPAPAEGWLVEALSAHYAATIGVPLSAIAAFCVVVLLNVISKGDIEFSVVGFGFKGASGPVILWVMCFLALVAGFEVLWNNTP